MTFAELSAAVLMCPASPQHLSSTFHTPCRLLCAADARTQTLLQAQVAWNMGLIDLPQKEAAEALQNKIVNLMDDRDWRKARKMADQLMAFLANASGSATLEDIRR